MRFSPVEEPEALKKNVLAASQLASSLQLSSTEPKLELLRVLRASV
jgi:hypothetical protein